MKRNSKQICHLGPEISAEQFIEDHYFIYLLKGTMKAYDGSRYYMMTPGSCFIARKNHLVRYAKYQTGNEFELIAIAFQETFLKDFLSRYPHKTSPFINQDSFLFLRESELILNYIASLAPNYTQKHQLDDVFWNIKREELLLILIKSQPILADALFNFSVPEKIDLEAFINRNYRFNVSLERFAFLTGRSLSAFKRDFKKIFDANPGSWLKKKRLNEAYFQISIEHRKPNDIYFEVGFEDLSHFSFAFKKEFGQTPREVYKKTSVKKISLEITYP